MSQTRTCNNGVLSGSTTYSYLSCSSGCGSFGVNGTVKTGVIVGAVSVPVTCQFGEAGIFSVYNQVDDQTCSNGQIVTSNLRQGDLVTAGVCPTYSWVATANWTTCSADCGGTQLLVYECRDSYNQLAPADHCAGTAPVQTRACDGNPSAANRTDVSTSVETAPSTTAQCPANQVGVTTSQRTDTTTTVYACINHQVAVQSQTTSYGAWQTQTTCRDIQVTYCEQDQLSDKEAEGRHAWMEKCRDKVSAIKDFMHDYDDVKTCGGYSMHSKTHHFYPTFIDYDDRDDRDDRHEHVWRAPTDDGDSCDVPKSAEVGAVCIPGGATPEMQILALEDKGKDMKYLPFVDALLKNYKYVETPKFRSHHHCDHDDRDCDDDDHHHGDYDHDDHDRDRDNRDRDDRRFGHGDDDDHHDARHCTNPKHHHENDDDDDGIHAKVVQPTRVKSWITDKEDIDHEIVEFHLESGRILRLTPNHPVLTEEGRMKQAGDFQAGEKLVQLGGDLDRIVSVDNVAYHGKTYTVSVEAQDFRHNIIVTNGYLNGTGLFKYEDVGDLNRDLLRKKLCRHIFDDDEGDSDDHDRSHDRDNHDSHGGKR